MLADPAVVRASQKFVRVIIRRPHAYKFSADHDRIPIPGFAILGLDEKTAAKFEPTGKDAADFAKFLMK